MVFGLIHHFAAWLHAIFCAFGVADPEGSSYLFIGCIMDVVASADAQMAQLTQKQPKVEFVSPETLRRSQGQQVGFAIGACAGQQRFTLRYWSEPEHDLRAAADAGLRHFLDQ